ncbi:MAG: hypothetical protein ACYS0D_05465 [Planctomycetota bacterium]|jgi:hypothetical protein
MNGEERERIGAPAIAAVALAALLGSTANASASWVRFDNPEFGQQDHFDWTWSDALDPLSWLDITKPSSDQGGMAGPTSVGQLYPDGQPGVMSNETMGGAQVGRLFQLTQAIAYLDEVSDSTLSFFDFSVHAVATDLWIASLIPEGAESYIGVAFLDDDQATHYGWIGVVRTALELETFAWGYETEPNTPIPAGAAAPAPGALALLVVAALTAPMRRNRRR